MPDGFPSFSAEPIHEFINANCFPDFGSSSFPVFALGPVSYPDLKHISAVVNEQARAEINFDPDEFEELGHVIDVPEQWDLNGKSIEEAVRHYFSLFDPCERLKNGDPKWYPVGFVAALKKEWQNKGLILGYLQKEEGYLAFKSCVVKPDELGGCLISFRQGNAEFDHVRKFLEADRD